MHLLERLSIPSRVAADSHFGDTSIDRSYAIAGIGMIAQELRHALTSLLLERLEEARHVPWIVSGVGHNIGTFQVSLSLSTAAELEKRDVGSIPANLLNCV